MPTIKNPAIRERNTRLFFGCSESCALALNGGLPLRTKHTFAGRYISQRTKANLRGIGWEITFPEWLALWGESGKWRLRGAGKGSYCMARHNDVGPYKLGNVSIQLIEVNSRDGVKLAHASSQANGTMRHMLATGRGWTFIKRNLTNPYQVCVAHKYIGCFSTQEKAEAAYQTACDLYRCELASHQPI